MVAMVPRGLWSPDKVLALLDLPLPTVDSHLRMVREAADKQCHHTTATRAAESEALALVKERHRHEAAMWAAPSATSPLADEQRRQEAADCTVAAEVRSCSNTIVAQANSHFDVMLAALPNHINTAIRQVQAMRDVLAAPLDAILAKIEREDIKEGAQTTSLVVASSTPLAIIGNLQKVHATPLTSQTPIWIALNWK